MRIDEPGGQDQAARVDGARRGSVTRPTPTIRPSRTATEPVTDGVPVPSMMRALVMRRSKRAAGRLCREGRGAERGGRQSQADLFHGRIISPPKWPVSAHPPVIAFPGHRSCTYVVRHF